MAYICGVPRLLYIVLLFVTVCRIAAIAAPVIQGSAVDISVMYDSECNCEENEADKSKYEYKEESALAPDVHLHYSSGRQTHHLLSDNKLLQHMQQPASPPPDCA